MTTTLKLKADPTFDAPVNIPVAGGPPVEVRFTFKHHGRAAVRRLLEPDSEATDDDLLMNVVSGWELDDEFDQVNMQRLLDNYHGAGTAILSTYLRELRGVR